MLTASNCPTLSARMARFRLLRDFGLDLGLASGSRNWVDIRGLGQAARFLAADQAVEAQAGACPHLGGQRDVATHCRSFWGLGVAGFAARGCGSGFRV